MIESSLVCECFQGGLKAVVWTDVFQFFLIIIGMLTIVIRGFYTAGGISEAFSTAYSHGRLELFK
jgi:Na+/proline symporter